MKRNKLLYALLAINSFILVGCVQNLNGTSTSSVLAGNPTSTVKLTLDPNGGTVNGSSQIFTIDYNQGEQVTLPSASKEGYAFSGWLDEEQKLMENTFVISRDITLTASYGQPEVKLTLDADGGTLATTEQTVKFGGSFILPPPQKSRYNFVGWYLGEEQITDSTGKSLKASTFIKEETLKARYEVSRVVTLEFYIADTLQPRKRETYLDDDIKGILTFNDIQYEGFYEGWYADKEMTKKITSTSDIVITDEILDNRNVARVYAKSTPEFYAFSTSPDTLTEYSGTAESVDLNNVFYKGKTVTKIADSAFRKAGATLKEVIVADTVTEIGDYAFEDNAVLTKVVLPEGLTSIGGSAFVRNRLLTDINIPSTVIYIGDSAFAGCDALPSLTLPEGITTIENGTFNGCNSLTSINIPSTVTRIGMNAFKSCESLASIVIPSSVTEIGDWAFQLCTSLKSIYIPKSVTDVGNETFKSADVLTIYTENAEKPSTWLSIWNRSSSSRDCPVVWNAKGEMGNSEGFDYAVLNDDTVTITGYTGTATEVVIPSSIEGKTVTSINQSAFKDNKTITSIEIPSGIISIGDEAFSNIATLTSVTMADTVTSIGASAFSSNVALTSVKLSNALTSIGNSAFAGDKALTTITIPKSVTAIGFYAFSGCDALTITTEIKESEKPADWKEQWNGTCEVVWVPENPAN